MVKLALQALVQRGSDTDMKVIDVVAAPIRLAQLATGAKSFEHPLIGSRRLNRMGLHRRRVELAARMADRRRAWLAGRIDGEMREQYAHNGFVRVENFLPADVFDTVLREVETGAFQRYDMVQGRTVTRRALIDDRDLADKPGLRLARDDHRMLDLIRYVGSHAGAPLRTLQVVMAAAPDEHGKRDPQTALHSDTFQPTAKAWLFLYDVGPDDGPFMYVPGSHRVTAERMAWEEGIALDPRTAKNRYALRGSLRVAQGDLAALGYGEPVPMVVKANTLIVADTHGFHARSPSPRATTRMEIYGSLRRNPFLPVPLPSPVSLPGVEGRTNRLVIDGLATLKRLGIRGSPWQDQGIGPATQWPAVLDER